LPKRASRGSSADPAVTLRITDEFIASLAEIQSDKLLGRIYDQVNLVSAYPDSGSPDVRPSLTFRYGQGLRKLVVPPYIIVYRHADEFVDVLALVHGPAVK
jgi:plasmid stabilization system protein ParE